MEQRDSWGSKAGFILAAAGSAVGLGNIWKFPYVAGNSGGGAFVLIYLFFVIFVGFSVMLAELAIGRKNHQSAVGAFKTVDKKWSFVGLLSVFSVMLIMGFYPVVGGWSMAYITKGFTGLLSQPDVIPQAFSNFTSNGIQPLLWTLAFLGLNIAIVMKGISGGIEKVSKVLMPLLFILLIVIAGYGLTLPGAGAGLEFLFKPDFSAITPKVVLSALGQAFFSLSLGMGAMITYGSYLNKEENLISSAGLVTGMDTFVALLSGIAMFPAMFAFGLTPDVGPGLVYVVVPTIFSNMGAIGPFMSLFFFVALTVAALTSSVSLLEVVSSFLIDEKGFSRKKAVALSGTVMFIMCIFASLSVGNVGPKLFGLGAFDIFDLLTDKIFLAICGLCVCLFVGFRLNKQEVIDEVTNNGTIKFKFINVWYMLVKYVIPFVIAAVAIGGIISGIEDGHAYLMIFGLGIIGVFALFSKKI